MATELTTSPSQSADGRPLLDALTAIRTRRAVKEYDQTPIPRAAIEELLDAARWAPNHKLTHPWRFHVFMGEGRERLVAPREEAMRLGARAKGKEIGPDDLAGARGKVFSAPVLVIVSQVKNDNPITAKEDYAAVW